MKPKKGGRTPEGLYVQPNTGWRFGALVKEHRSAGLRQIEPTEVLLTGQPVEALLKKRLAGAKILEACLESPPDNTIYHKTIKDISFLIPIEGEESPPLKRTTLAEIPPNEVN